MYFKFHIIPKIIFLILLFSHSLFSAVAMPARSQEATLYQNGEDAMKRGDITEASEHYKALWERVLKQKRLLMNTQTELEDNFSKDIALRYIAILKMRKEHEKIEKIIQQMVELFPAKIIPEIYFERAKDLCTKNSSQEAFLLLDAYQKELNFKLWPLKMQTTYKALEFSLNEYYKKRLIEAEGLLVEGKSERAEVIFTEVTQAIEKGLFPAYKMIQ